MPARSCWRRKLSSVSASDSDRLNVLMTTETSGAAFVRITLRLREHDRLVAALEAALEAASSEHVQHQQRADNARRHQLRRGTARIGRMGTFTLRRGHKE